MSQRISFEVLASTLTTNTTFATAIFVNNTIIHVVAVNTYWDCGILSANHSWNRRILRIQFAKIFRNNIKNFSVTFGTKISQFQKLVEIIKNNAFSIWNFLFNLRFPFFN